MVAYIGLFIVLMAMIKVAYGQVYERVKLKVSLLFTCLVLIMAFRWFIYLCLQFSWIGFDLENVISEIPFYVSELLITSGYIFFLTKVYDSKPEEVKPSPKSEVKKIITEEEYR